MPTARDFNSGGEALKAFVWYLPSGESIGDEDLDPELRDALKALGYIE